MVTLSSTDSSEDADQLFETANEQVGVKPPTFNHLIYSTM